MLEKALRVTLQAAQISLLYPSSFFWRASGSSSDHGPQTLQTKSLCVSISHFPASKITLQVIPLRTLHLLGESLLVLQSPDSCWCHLGSWEWCVCLFRRSVGGHAFVCICGVCVHVPNRNSNLNLTTSCTRNFTSVGRQILLSLTLFCTVSFKTHI